MSQKNTLLVVSLLTLFTVSINAAERQVTASDLKIRSGQLVKALEALQVKINNDAIEEDEGMRQLEALQKEQAALNKKLANLLK